MSAETPPQHEGCLAPERSHRVLSNGVELNVLEWGDPESPPLLLTHGMFDHAHCFDLLAPLLAPHFRVLAADARGHGESGWADVYNWPDEVLDIVHLLEWIGRPAQLVGHSKGGGQATDAAALAPQYVRQLVNLDGFGPPDEGFAPAGKRAVLDLDVGPAERFEHHLDQRRGLKQRPGWRPYADFDALVDRRLEQNPRLGRSWIRYFSYYGARHDPDGWRWRVDPLAGWGFGPFKPEWIAPGWQHVRMPVLAVVGSVPDRWGPLPEPLLSERLAHFPDVERAVVEDSGHFLAIEAPTAVAELILAFLDR